MQINLEGTALLVTGTSRGIGRAIAKQLVESGARVALHCNRNLEEASTLADTFANGSQAFQADLSEPDQVSSLFDQALASFGKIDGLVNNAGIALSTPLSESNEDWLASWQKTLAVNTTAVGILCRQAVLHFEQHGGGRIVNIASRASFRGDTPDYIAYAASKAAVIGITRSIARNYGKQNIKAFDIAPGFTRTDMAQDFMDQYGEEYALNDIALTKLTEPSDIAPMVAFLLSGMADHATGTTIQMNAGSYVH
ncbi:MAG TPA: 3-oxoacyl-ACP reductase [Cytophagales bacterium]|nr:3-oxoacyl-ACP reductase [Cytophagales bacterium]HAA23668.1 3-oxoacyl-ACP reductase [Cytophagales bacterium]HAP59256.1 3-oxoacyl-ACP reductase [Cytophagales bacterium]